MTRFLRQTGALVTLSGVQALFGLMLLSNAAMADTPLPTIHEPEDEGIKCIHPEDEMRRNHMNYILHERDETMHEGIRGEPASLANCINCHVTPDEKGEIASIHSKEHFCNACHQYAAVQIDCFQCHADRPQKYISHNKNASLMQQPQTLAARALETQAFAGAGVKQ